MPYYVYILANGKNGALFVGVTNDIVQRVGEHKTEAVLGAAKRRSPQMLVYVEEAQDIDRAIVREKHIKKWERAWKLQLIERHNPGWIDLYPKLVKERAT
jgi:putative endonuclease